ncbi:MAG: hypothetical protein ACRD9W_03645, partial [Terriglobia bacterium]
MLALDHEGFEPLLLQQDSECQSGDTGTGDEDFAVAYHFALPKPPDGLEEFGELAGFCQFGGAKVYALSVPTHPAP